jgi:uncharacterized repeat protein (TIGR03803 family)
MGEFMGTKISARSAVAATFAFSLLLCGATHAATLHTLYSFCTAKKCSDGVQPQTGLMMDASGNIFGTTSDGGANNHGGTIFELSPKKSKWTYSVLYSFCAQKKCADGNGPSSRVVLDTEGNLYGTTVDGGSTDDGGTVFKLAPAGGEWTLQVLHSFCTEGGKKCTDGEYPYPGVNLTYPGAASGALYDGTSPLYGTAENEGIAKKNGGVAYRLTPNGGDWTYDVLYDFCARKKCADGKSPQSGMVLDQSGNLFGMTFRGATGDNPGIIFELSPSKKDIWRETVLHPFCPDSGCLDGSNPTGDLIMDATGNLFGTAQEGGTGAPDCGSEFVRLGCGVVFKLTPDGKQSQQEVLYNFCSQTDCTDGDTPTGGLIMDADGNLYGTTFSGGAANQGTVFKISNGTEQVLYSFCTQGGCTDGSMPSAPLIMDKNGNLYGTTSTGGVYGQGTVFEITP